MNSLGSWTIINWLKKRLNVFTTWATTRLSEAAITAAAARGDEEKMKNRLTDETDCQEWNNNTYLSCYYSCHRLITRAFYDYLLLNLRFFVGQNWINDREYKGQLFSFVIHWCVIVYVSFPIWKRLPTFLVHFVFIQLTMCWCDEVLLMFYVYSTLLNLLQDF